jgi:hypothetical protein
MTPGVREYKADAVLVHGPVTVEGLAHVVEVTRGRRVHLSLVIELTTDQYSAASGMFARPEPVVLFLGPERRRALVRLHGTAREVDYFAVDGTGTIAEFPEPGASVIVVRPGQTN